jgi:hypothetical protein
MEQPTQIDVRYFWTELQGLIVEAQEHVNNNFIAKVNGNPHAVEIAGYWQHRLQTLREIRRLVEESAKRIHNDGCHV